MLKADSLPSGPLGKPCGVALLWVKEVEVCKRREIEKKQICVALLQVSEAISSAYNPESGKELAIFLIFRK